MMKYNPLSIQTYQKFPRGIMNLQLLNKVDRDGAEALIPEDAAKEIIKNVPQRSAIMQLGRRLPNMTTKQRRLPILASLIQAYFVTGDTGRKKTAKTEWANKYINAEELAVIVPIPEAVLDDVNYDIWAEVRPQIEEAFGIAFDAAVMHGTNAPADWPTDLVGGATAAGNVVALGTNDDIYDDILSEGGTLSLVEEDGYDITGHVAAMTMKSKLRGLRDSAGNPIFNRSMQDTTRYELDGAETMFPKNGALDRDEALLLSGDWTQLVYAIRQDITYKILTEAVIQDTDGSILYNLAQQDMVAIRAVMRLGWELPNPINRLNENAATRYPFGILTPPAVG